MLEDDQWNLQLENIGDRQDIEPLREDDSTAELARRLMDLEEELPDVSVLDDDSRADQEQPIRPELVERVLNILRADSERAGGNLQRSDLERQCFRRDLNIPECLRVEAMLNQGGVEITDPIELRSDFGSASSEPQRGRSYLSDLEERELGRTIQLARRASLSNSEVDSAYLARLKQAATAAKAQFVETNIRYVRRVALRYAHYRHMTEDDIFQEGIIGLLRATESYDPEIGFRFKTYATWWIDQKIQRAIDDKDRIVRLPVHVVEKVRAVRRAARALLSETGEEPGIRQLADTVGMESDRLAQLLWTVGVTECVDGDAPADKDSDEGGASLFAFVPDRHAPSPFDVAYRDELIRIVREKLTKREARVILLRFGLTSAGEHTLEEVGAKYGLTRERIRQIQDKALAKLRPAIEKTVYERAIDHGGVFRTWR